MLDKAGEVFKREPGLEIRRARVDGDNRTGLYEITFWQQFKTYATVSKLDLSRLVDELSSLTVIESADLAKMLQRKWGIP
jgi:predicted DNA-binding ribbon-helix-helix protein